MAANSYLIFGIGIVCAGVGGELLVRGTVGLAQWFRISPALVATTIGAFATSSPELTVSISAAVSGIPQLALGDSLGSNVVNVALILGLVLVIGRVRSPRRTVNRDFAVALAVPAGTALLLLDGVLSRIDAAVLLGPFIAWLVAVIRESLRQRQAVEEWTGIRRRSLAVVVTLVGLALLIAAGRLIVTGAVAIASDLGVGQFAIGAIVVAVGTSVPELATAVIAKLRGYDEVGLGTILGSNIFNGLLIVGVASAISPIAISARQAAPALAFGLAAVVVTYPNGSGVIPRWRGVVLLALYGAYLAALAVEAAG